MQTPITNDLCSASIDSNTPLQEVPKARRMSPSESPPRLFHVGDLDSVRQAHLGMRLCQPYQGLQLSGVRGHLATPAANLAKGESVIKHRHQ